MDRILFSVLISRYVPLKGSQKFCEKDRTIRTYFRIMRVVKLLVASIFHHLTRLDSKRNYTKRSIGLAKFAGRPLLGKKIGSFMIRK